MIHKTPTEYTKKTHKGHTYGIHDTPRIHTHDTQGHTYDTQNLHRTHKEHKQDTQETHKGHTGHTKDTQRNPKKMTQKF